MNPETFKPWARFLAWCLLLLVLLGVAIATALETGWFEIPREALVERYRLASSRFADIDGVQVHYVDEGEGDAVLLLHASYLSLHSWEELAGRLAGRYRVIRLDLSGAGLTGMDPGGRYGIERNIELVQGLLDYLDIERVALVGTSSGGIVAFRLAAQAPERVSRLVLINSAGLPRTAWTDPLRSRVSPVSAWIQQRLRSRDFWEQSLSNNFIAPNRPSTELVTMTFDMNRRTGGREVTRRFLAAFSTGDPAMELGRIRAPTLVQWGKDNRTLVHLEAEVFGYWLRSAPHLIKKYDGLGHYAYIESPQVIADDIAAFLDGRLDDQLMD